MCVRRGSVCYKILFYHLLFKLCKVNTDITFHCIKDDDEDEDDEMLITNVFFMFCYLGGGHFLLLWGGGGGCWSGSQNYF